MPVEEEKERRNTRAYALLLNRIKMISKEFEDIYFSYMLGEQVDVQKVSEIFMKFKESEGESNDENIEKKKEIENKYREIIEIESTVRLLQQNIEKFKNQSTEKQKLRIKKFYDESKKVIPNNMLLLKFSDVMDNAEDIIETIEIVADQNMIKQQNKYQSMPNISQLKLDDQSGSEISRNNSVPKLNSTDETSFNQQLINLVSTSSVKNEPIKINEFHNKSNDIKAEMKRKEIYNMQKGNNWFDGDYLQYHRFKKRVDKAFENMEFNDDEKLDLLKNVIKGRPSKIIEPVTTFQEAIETLDRVYTRVDYQKTTIKEQLGTLTKINRIAEFRRNNTFIETVHGCFEQLKRILPNEKDSFFTDCIRIILSKLPQETMTEFTKIDEDMTPDKFIKFLIQQESIAERWDKWESNPQINNKNSRVNVIRPDETRIYCKFHNNNQHSSTRCDLTNDEKVKIIQQKNWCKKCATYHKTKECFRKNLKCNFCGEDHLTYMHELMNYTTNEKSADSGETRIKQHVQSTKIAINKSELSYAETATATIVANNKSEDLRLIIDSASDFSFIDKKFVEKLNLKTFEAGICLVLRGINQSESPKRSSTFTYLQFNGGHNRNMIRIKFFIVDDLAEALGYSSNPFDLRHIMPDEIISNLADNSNRKLQALIGLDQRHKIYRQNTIKIIDKYVIIDTIFGFMISGNESTKSRTTRIFACKIEEDYEFKSADEEFEIHNQPEIQMNQYIQDYKTNKIMMSENNRYVASLCWIPKFKDLITNNEWYAIMRLQQLLKMLKRRELLVEYDKKFKEMINGGYIVKTDRSELHYFLPHRPVIKSERSTTKLRIVKDGTFNLKNQTSINQALYKGVVEADVMKTLIRFRAKKIGITSDIEKAFWQIKVDDQDQKYLGLIWIDEYEKFQYFRMTVVPFGLTCSPFILQSTIQKHCEDTKLYPEISNELASKFYVDDYVNSMDNLPDAIENKTKIQEILKEASFNIRKWTMSGDNVEPVRVLGIWWNPQTDEIYLNEPKFEIPVKITRRFIQSICAKLFDPLGIIAPVKILLRELNRKACQLNLDWDDEVPQEMNDIVQQTIKNIDELFETIKLRRTIIKSNSILIYCDASATAYGAVAYLANNEEKLLLLSKNYLSNKTTIPELEFMALMVGIRVMEIVK
uniref:Uncharacterized protein LOC113794857 n=1 Tax=Dermatophagoides pteronyssinus TaxID=6956 RepID=A0A6P6Y677_DERPT